MKRPLDVAFVTALQPWYETLRLVVGHRPGEVWLMGKCSMCSERVLYRAEGLKGDGFQRVRPDALMRCSHGPMTFEWGYFPDCPVCLLGVALRSSEEPDGTLLTLSDWRNQMLDRYYRN